jgi:hypothetical protein
VARRPLDPLYCRDCFNVVSCCLTVLVFPSHSFYKPPSALAMPNSSDTSSRKPARTREWKPRGRGLRTRTGCLTCRKRHLKCNEVKPVCGPCTRSNHTCLYADPSALKSESTSISNSNSTSASKSPSATVSASSSAPPSIAAQTDIESLQADSAEPFDPAVRTQWSHRNVSNDIPSHFLSRPTSWPLKDSHTSAPHQVTGPEYDRHGLPSTRWTPSFEDPDSCRFGQGPPSLQSDIMSPPAPYLQTLVPVNIARSHTGSEGILITSQVPASGPNRDAAVVRWFGLLAGDTDFQKRNTGPDTGLGHRETTNDEHSQSFVTRNSPGRQAWEDRRTSPPIAGVGSSVPGQGSGRPPTDRMSPSDTHLWQSKETLPMQARDVEVFDNFVTRISHWLDLFDPMQNFSTCVPHLAMHNIGLLNAILALSIRHSSLTPKHVSKTVCNRNDALQYYHETLRYIQNAMRHDSYNSSDELLATCLIISAYEMIDCSRKDWERHLQGFYRLQRSQVIHGDSKGLKQAVWWAWLCQDVWAAFREKRKPFTSWHPSRDYGDMTSYELAARSVYLMSRVISYCSQEEIDQGEQDVKGRVAKADHLADMLDEWQQQLPIEFSPLPMSTERKSVFKPIWIHPPAFSMSSNPRL